MFVAMQPTFAILLLVGWLLCNKHLPSTVGCYATNSTGVVSVSMEIFNYDCLVTAAFGQTLHNIYSPPNSTIQTWTEGPLLQRTWYLTWKGECRWNQYHVPWRKQNKNEFSRSWEQAQPYARVGNINGLIQNPVKRCLCRIYSHVYRFQTRGYGIICRDVASNGHIFVRYMEIKKKLANYHNISDRYPLLFETSI
jgi:hypothetical protein